MKKIAIFTVSTNGGGAERVSTILANSLSENHSVFFCALNDNGFYQLKTEVSIRIFSEKTKLGQFRSIAKFLREYSIGLVIALGYPVAIKLAFVKTFFYRGFRLISSERNDPSRNIKSIFKKGLRKWAYNKSYRIVFQTEEARDFFSRKIRKKGVVIPNPFLNNAGRFNNSGLGKNKIIAVGRINPQKNFSMLVTAFSFFYKKHPDYSLDIFGDGSIEEKIKINNLISSFGLDNVIHLKGFSNNIFQEYSNYSIYVSSSDYEGISNSIIEAMANGLACVCTDCPCGGTRTLIENGTNGLLVPVNDSVSMFEALEKLASDNDLRIKLSENAKRIVTKLNPLNIARQWMELFDD